jgi:hypothetical protein
VGSRGDAAAAVACLPASSTEAHVPVVFSFLSLVVESKHHFLRVFIVIIKIVM